MPRPPTADQVLREYMALVEAAAAEGKDWAEPRLHLGDADLPDGALTPGFDLTATVGDKLPPWVAVTPPNMLRVVGHALQAGGVGNPEWAAFASEGWIKSAPVSEANDTYQRGSIEAEFKAGKPNTAEGAMAYVVTRSAESSFAQATYERQPDGRLVWGPIDVGPESEIAGDVPAALAFVVGVDTE